MFKRLISTLLALLLISTLLVGCSFTRKQNKTPEEEPVSPKTAVQTDNGTYLGQIDSNSIEIEVTEGTEKMPKAFQLSEEIKEDFAEYDLNTDDKISFTYSIPQEGQPILTEIKKQE